MHLFSPAQLLGYVALVLGVAAFLQKTDRRLKALLSGESAVYTLHFLLLGNIPAAISASLSSLRNGLAIRFRAPWLAGLFFVLHLGLGGAAVRHPAGWLPVLACCLATYVVFYWTGVRLRLVLLVCTLLWLANNILSGSIGGTILELFIAAANLATIFRMLRTSAAVKLQPLPGASGAD